MKIRKISTCILLASFLIASASGCVVADVFARARQLRTYTNMQAIVGRIEEFRLVNGDKNLDALVSAFIKTEGEGRDEWGNSFIYKSRRDSSGFAYLLVSWGSDGSLDVASVDQYFHAPQESVSGKFERDIVFLNGSALKRAGK